MNNYPVLRLVSNPYLKDDTYETQAIGLSMADQWRIWGWKVWKYKETWFWDKFIPAQLYQAGYTVYGHPRAIKRLQDALAN